MSLRYRFQVFLTRFDRRLHPRRYRNYRVCRHCGSVKRKDDMVLDIHWGWFCSTGEILDYWRHNVVSGGGKLAHKQAFLYYAVLAMVCAHFALAYSGQLPIYGSFYDFATGNVPGPFNTRILMSLVFKGALKWKSFAAFSHRLPAPYNDPLSLVMVPIVAASLFATTEAVRVISRNLGAQESISRWGSFCVPLISYFNFILTLEIRFQSPYDLTQVAVFTLCLGAILSRNRLLYYGLFILGTVNKETTCFLIPVFGLLELHSEEGLPGRWLGIELVLQTALWLQIRYVTSHWYTQHPTLALIVWRQNVRFLLSPLHWPTILSAFAFLWAPYLIYFRRIGHKGLQSCVMVFPLWGAVMFVVGDFLEIRIHSEWIGYLAVCLLLIATNLFGFQSERVHRTSERLIQKHTTT